MTLVKSLSYLSLITAFALTATSCSRPETAQSETSEIRTQLNETEIFSGALAGAYVNAGENAPVVIMVPGSGPTDRDSNNGALVSNALKFLAEGLAQNNISSIRVDKRGLFSSVEAGDPNAVTVNLYGEDYRGWVKTAIEATGQDCAFLLGHSEGGLMVSAAALGQTNVCGVITVASPGSRASDVLRTQLKANPANFPILKQAEKAIAALEAGERVDISKMNKALRPLFNPQVQDFLISVFAVDPAQVLAAVDAPKLVIQGEHDLQVSIADGRRLSEASGAQLVMIPKMNHVLKTAPKRRLANFKAYNSPDVPIDARVTEAVTVFVNAHK